MPIQEAVAEPGIGQDRDRNYRDTSIR